jgi:thioesterase domain-containing protein
MVPLYGLTRGRRERRLDVEASPLHDHLVKATRRYYPKRHAQPVFIIRGEAQPRGCGMDALGWSEFAAGPIRAATALGDHAQMFEPPNVEALANIILTQ